MFLNGAQILLFYAVRFSRLLLACVLICCQASNANAGSHEQPSEYAVTSTYIYNIAKFVKWDAAPFTDATQPLSICSLGPASYRDSLSPLVDKSSTSDNTVLGRPVSVNHFQSIEEVEGCHVLYITRPKRVRIRKIIRELANQPILTVSDIKNFANFGGMIALATADDKLVFDINVTAATEAGLSISSKLLRLARDVIGTPVETTQ